MTTDTRTTAEFIADALDYAASQSLRPEFQERCRAEAAKLREEPPFSPGDLALIAEALDSHVYWQLSPGDRRDSGFVLEPHTDEEKACMALEERVRKLIPTQEQ